MRIKTVAILLFLFLLCGNAHAALQHYVGTGLSKTGSTGTLGYTGVGFQPLAVIFIVPGNATADPEYSTTKGAMGYGLTDGTRNEFAAWAGRTNAVSSSVSNYYQNTKCINFGHSATGTNGYTTLAEASISSLDIDGFTLNYSTVNATAYEFMYIAIGGSGISVYVGELTEGAELGNYSTTAPGFQPDFLFAFSGGRTTTGSDNTLRGSVGLAVSSTERGMTFHIAHNGQSAVPIKNRLLTTTLQQFTSALNDTILSDSDFVSFDTTGFTLDRNTDDAVDRLSGYLVIKGVTADVRQITQHTSATTNATSGVGFQPSFLWLIGHGSSSATETNVDAEETSGAATSTTNRAVAAFEYNKNGTNDQDSAKAFDTTDVYITGDATTPTEEGRADLSSFDSDGFTLDYGTSDGTARLILAISLKDNTAAAPKTTIQSAFINGAFIN